jgi:hypothetical protein
VAGELLDGRYVRPGVEQVIVTPVARRALRAVAASRNLSKSSARRSKSRKTGRSSDPDERLERTDRVYAGN